MAFIRVTAPLLALTAAAVGFAAPASADQRLDGDYAFVNGATTNTWSINTQCNPEGVCGGTVSSSTGMVANISRPADGPWTVVRHDVPNGWTCANGTTGPADVVYAFDPATLAGTISNTSKPGTCGDPNAINNQQPVSLHLVRPTELFPVFSSS
ncbi:hypothetical protein [Mycobacterium deserti]|uniref:Secreted protein n=1 Tax=Mycobacterium deserti TaxID=2978347 RepID=A0ABT2MJQ7_9MYCO|nr:hypothetical protein [Mycobacterium deserti]MCT7661660.1 hypothetical protein [Mycobacterium deserti]